MNMGPLAWSGFRRIEMIRDALTWSLCGYAIDGRSPDTVLKWLTEQGFTTLPSFPSDDEHKEFVPKKFMPSHLVYPTIESEFIEKFGTVLGALVRLSDEPVDGLDEFLRERGGAHWSEPHSFLLSSALLRLLATLEDFEKMVLKALFFYFPSGRPTSPPKNAIVVDAKIITEQPQRDEGSNRLIYQMPFIWTWLRKPLERNEERKQAFRLVFGIDMPPPDTDRKALTAWREVRNAVAHGYTARRITLSEYVGAEAHAASVVKYLALQCARNFNLKL